MSYKKFKKIGEDFLMQVIIAAHMAACAIALIVVGIVRGKFYFAIIPTVFLVWLIYAIIYKQHKVDILEDKIQLKTLGKGIVNVIEYKQIYKMEYFTSPRWRSVEILYEKDSVKAKFGVGVDTLTWEDLKEFARFIKSKNSNVDISVFEDQW